MLSSDVTPLLLLAFVPNPSAGSAGPAGNEVIIAQHPGFVLTGQPLEGLEGLGGIAREI
jgi:hypothetical protein